MLARFLADTLVPTRFLRPCSWVRKAFPYGPCNSEQVVLSENDWGVSPPPTSLGP